MENIVKYTKTLSCTESTREVKDSDYEEELIMVNNLAIFQLQNNQITDYTLVNTYHKTDYIGYLLLGITLILYFTRVIIRGRIFFVANFRAIIHSKKTNIYTASNIAKMIWIVSSFLNYRRNEL